MSRRSKLFKRRYAGILSEDPDFVASKILADNSLRVLGSKKGVVSEPMRTGRALKIARSITRRKG